jgi:glutamyl-tRNA synthetase
MSLAEVSVGRLAPSPSGRLHLGHARTFALAWAHARSRSGQLRLRLEDLDRERCRPEHVQRIFRDLEWLGLDWDGEPLYQSQRIDALREAAARLERAGVAYRCICSRAELERAAQAPQRGVTELRYPGTCRARLSAEAQRDIPDRSALRFAVPEGLISFVDGLAGPQQVDVSAEVGDFVILSRNAVPAYQLAVVVDDAEQGVTEVFRGDDLLTSSARQMLLQQALGLASPRWFHAPLVLDASGRRLAKRADDLSLEALREAGVDARAILGWVGRSAGLSSCEPLATARELASAYQPTHLRREPTLLSAQDIDALLATRPR